MWAAVSSWQGSPGIANRRWLWRRIGGKPASGQFQPGRRMVRRLFHCAQLIVHTRRLDPWQQAVGGEDQVNAQAALGLVLEAAAAVVEPAEAVGHFRVQVTEA